ncbi:unnamed protein product, partial [marine sediment metagenome]
DIKTGVQNQLAFYDTTTSIDNAANIEYAATSVIFPTANNTGTIGKNSNRFATGYFRSMNLGVETLYVTSTGTPSFAMGYSLGTSAGYVESDSTAGVSFGAIYNKSPYVFSSINNIAGGYSAYGSLAHGYIYSAKGDTPGWTCDISTEAFGAIAGGAMHANESLCYIHATGHGAIAHGWIFAYNAMDYTKIIASGLGSIAIGYAKTGATIEASAYGSGAFGYAYSDSNDIRATAASAFQFGSGTNATADSLQVGSSVI